MKKLLFVIIFVLAGLNFAYAVPAYPHPIQVTQPDGTVLTIRIHGDEYLNWTTCGNSLVVKGSDGYYHYASFGSDRVPQSIGAIVRATPSGDGSSVNPPQSAFEQANARRMQAAMSDGIHKTANQVSGSSHYLVVLINFSDKDFTHTKQNFQNLLNQTGYGDNGGTGSALDYYSDNSHGVFTPVFDVVGPVTVSNTCAYYGSQDQGINQETGAPALLTEACRILNETTSINFADYDLDKDGYIDNVFFYYAGYNQAEGVANTIWPHKWQVDSQPFFDGVRLYKYACTSELRGTSGNQMCGIGTFCHEFGHVIGLPDFYDTDKEVYGQAYALLTLSLMSNGNYNNDGRTPPYLTYEERHILGWDNKTTLTLLKEGTNELSPISENKAYYCPTATDGEYYLFESRPAAGWDLYTKNSGLAVYHIDKSDYMMPIGYTAKELWKYGQLINNFANHQCMDLVESVGVETNLQVLNQLVFPGYYNETSFTSETTPGSLSWSGAPTGYNITNISFNSGTGVTTFDVQKERKVMGTVKKVSGEPLSGVDIHLTFLSPSPAAARVPSSDGSGLFAISLTGEPGAKGYKVKTDANGAFEVAVSDVGSYSVSASKEGYFPYNGSVTVDAVSEVNIILPTPLDNSGVTLKKYSDISNNGLGPNESGYNYYVGLKYNSGELTGYEGSPIKSISFLAFNGGAFTVDKMGVRVYFDDICQCDCEAKTHIFGAICTVDISKFNLSIPFGKSVTFVYYLLNSSYGYPMALADINAPVTNANLYKYSENYNWTACPYGNFVISATITDKGKVIDLSGFNTIATQSSYTAGTPFNLTLNESTVNPPSGVTWKVDGADTNPTGVILSAGTHTVRANVTYASGRTEVIETKIQVQ